MNYDPYKKCGCACMAMFMILIDMWGLGLSPQALKVSVLFCKLGLGRNYCMIGNWVNIRIGSISINLGVLD